jgi:hypothetical protein
MDTTGSILEKIDTSEQLEDRNAAVWTQALIAWLIFRDIQDAHHRETKGKDKDLKDVLLEDILSALAHRVYDDNDTKKHTFSGLLSTHSHLHGPDTLHFLHDYALVQVLISMRQIFAMVIDNTTTAIEFDGQRIDATQIAKQTEECYNYLAQKAEETFKKYKASIQEGVEDAHVLRLLRKSFEIIVRNAQHIDTNEIDFQTVVAYFAENSSSPQPQMKDLNDQVQLEFAGGGSNAAAAAAASAGSAAAAAPGPPKKRTIRPTHGP